MKLSISNIAWQDKHDEEIYAYLKSLNFEGLEIAPSKFIGEEPYNKNIEAQEKSKELKSRYNLEVPSMQSIWFGQAGNIFNKDEAKVLIDYTKKAINFAEMIGCKNLVFGCPKNRNNENEIDEDDIIYFFKEIGDYAVAHNTIVALEPNPTIYGTNFMNCTKDAIRMVEKINNSGIKLNVDLGTIIENGENLEFIDKYISLINHVHISEPYLNPLETRSIHKDLLNKLKENGYEKYISIEMKTIEEIEVVKEKILYINKLWGDI